MYEIYYWAAFTVAFVCFAYHTIVHVLEHRGRVEKKGAIHMGIEISMFAGWFSYFFISFTGLAMGVSVFNYVGIPLLVIGFYLWVTSHIKIHGRLHKGENKLITDGIYRRIRHPMYVGNILVFIGAPVLGGSLITLLLSPIFIAQTLIWGYMEESGLRKEFGKAYENYRKLTWF